MIIYPAVDIKDGKCVRLLQGEFDKVTEFAKEPMDMAMKWKEQGAEFLHTVDLDGARSGKGKNRKIVVDIAKKIGIPVQLGGGIRTLYDVESLIKSNIKRVILGTSAVENPDILKKAVELFGEKVAVGIDAKDGIVAINGWEKKSNYKAYEFAKKIEEYGVKTIIYTDIARDGMLIGPNYEAMSMMKKSVAMEVIASGGVTKVSDIKRLKEEGLDGAIIGKALYTGDIDLKEAIKISKE